MHRSKQVTPSAHKLASLNLFFMSKQSSLDTGEGSKVEKTGTSPRRTMRLQFRKNIVQRPWNTKYTVSVKKIHRLCRYSEHINANPKNKPLLHKSFGPQLFLSINTSSFILIFLKDAEYKNERPHNQKAFSKIKPGHKLKLNQLSAVQKQKIVWSL